MGIYNAKCQILAVKKGISFFYINLVREHRRASIGV